MARVSDQPQRWSRARVYPDMWVDPDEDPRDSAGVSPEGELATLQDYLTNYRLTLLMKCEGLNAEQLARRSVSPSTMSLLGLLRHLAEVERDWRGWILPSDPHRSCMARATPTSAEHSPNRRWSTPHTPIWPVSRQPPMPCWPSTGSERASGEGRHRRPGAAGAHDRGVRPTLRPRGSVAGVHRRSRGPVRR
jgi:Protein of unknown function (DUF664)